jgi:UDP-glucose 4-epimerase
MSKGKILVTGGTGYIGSHTTVELIEQGYEVVIVDNLMNSQAFILDRIHQITGVLPKFYKFDLCEQAKVMNVFEENQDLIGVIHFAAAKAVGESVNNPLFYKRNNLMPMVNLLGAMAKYGVENFCFSSSCCVYG